MILISNKKFHCLETFMILNTSHGDIYYRRRKSKGGRQTERIFLYDFSKMPFSAVYSTVNSRQNIIKHLLSWKYFSHEENPTNIFAWKTLRLIFLRHFPKKNLSPQWRDWRKRNIHPWSCTQVLNILDQHVKSEAGHLSSQPEYKTWLILINILSICFL